MVCTNEVHAHPMKRYLSDVSHLPPPSYCSYQLPWQPDKVLVLELSVLLLYTLYRHMYREKGRGG